MAYVASGSSGDANSILCTYAKNETARRLYLVVLKQKNIHAWTPPRYRRCKPIVDAKEMKGTKMTDP